MRTSVHVQHLSSHVGPLGPGRARHPACGGGVAVAGCLTLGQLRMHHLRSTSRAAGPAKLDRPRRRSVARGLDPTGTPGFRGAGLARFDGTARERTLPHTAARAPELLRQCRSDATKGPSLRIGEPLRANGTAQVSHGRVTSAVPPRWQTRPGRRHERGTRRPCSRPRGRSLPVSIPRSPLPRVSTEESRRRDRCSRRALRWRRPWRAPPGRISTDECRRCRPGACRGARPCTSHHLRRTSRLRRRS